ncbi:MAG: biotin--[acetyl-CoA-carboxylase] ligase [Desulfobacterales bacterium]|nr:biotin--[acetyl-CoA-carboxylase] ligase [Desulfobacterales bacterium]
MQSHVNTMNPSNCRLEFWEGGLRSPMAPMNPEQLSRQNALWRSDINSFGPWMPAAADRSIQRLTDRIWQPSSGSGDNKIVICGPCGSAMDVAWDLAGNGRLEVWDSVISASQQSGRGQRQRTWKSPVGNLYAAWRWPDPGSLANPGWEGLLPLLAGYIAAQVLIEKGLSVRVKWPNDLLVGDRKVGGILLEQKSGRVVVGIGLNIESRPEDHLLRDDFAIPATSLKIENLAATPLALWLTMVTVGKTIFYQMVESIAPAEWRRILNRRLAWIGKRVRIRSGHSTPYEATVNGLAEDGGLELQAGSRTMVIYSGSLVPV